MYASVKISHLKGLNRIEPKPFDESWIMKLLQAPIFLKTCFMKCYDYLGDDF